jgi:hypothetical protein
MPTFIQLDVKKMVKKLKKGANKKQTKKNTVRQKKQQQSKKRDCRRERAYTLLTKNRNNRELEKSINLFIGEESDVTSEGENDDNNIEGQISEDAQMSVQLTKFTKNHQLPIRYR